MAKDDKSGDEQDATADDIMNIAGLRPILKVAKRGKPVSVVVGVTTAGEGIILLHKVMKPKNLCSRLIRQAKAIDLDIDARTLRFGRASIDRDDAAVLHLTFNKAPSGLALVAQIRKRLKPAGVSGVEFSAGLRP